MRRHPARPLMQEYLRATQLAERNVAAECKIREARAQAEATKLIAEAEAQAKASAQRVLMHADAEAKAAAQRIQTDIDNYAMAQVRCAPIEWSSPRPLARVRTAVCSMLCKTLACRSVACRHASWGLCPTCSHCESHVQTAEAEAAANRVLAEARKYSAEQVCCAHSSRGLGLIGARASAAHAFAGANMPGANMLSPHQRARGNFRTSAGGGGHARQDAGAG